MITVNGEGWEVYLVPPSHPRLTTPEGTQALGCCDDIRKTIYINDTLHPTKMRKVLCHELTHAAMYSYNIEIPDPEEEVLAELISNYGDEIVSLTNKIASKLKL